MSFTLSEIAEALGFPFVGNGDLVIQGLAEPMDAGPNDLALAMNQKYADSIHKSKAKAAILWTDADWKALGLDGAILVSRAGEVMPGLTKLMDNGPDIEPGIHASAVIDATAKIGANAAIGPFVVIGRQVRIGANARIASHVSIARGSEIGENCLIHAGVRISADTQIGRNFICQPNSSIGGDGFSFTVTGQKSSAEIIRDNSGTSDQKVDALTGSSQWARVHSVGNVVIGDNVEIGSTTAIDRGTIRATRIGNGTKIDNLVQIGHNCDIGDDCLICGACAVAGSVRMGNRVVLGGQSGVADNLFIGDDVIVGARSTVYTNVPKGRAIWGTPATRMDTQKAIFKEVRRLPRLAQKVRDLEMHFRDTQK